MSIIISILAFIVAIGVLVTVHEFGHFIVARRLGIRVLRFSIGFGRTLFSWRRRAADTEYIIAALPLGGYVKMLDEREGEVAPEERHLAFNLQPLWKRLLVVLAGPAFNLVFAVLAYWVIFMLGIPGIRPLVGAVPPGSPAAVAGFIREDQILAVNGSETATWDTVLLRLFAGVMQGRPVAVEVRGADGQRRELMLPIKDPRALTEPGKLLPGLGLSQWQPEAPPVIGQLSADGTAKKAGLETGDAILKVSDIPIRSPAQLVQILQASAGKTLAVTVQRDGHSLSLSLPVGRYRAEDGHVVGHIGAQVGYSQAVRERLQAEQRYNPAAALGHALTRTGSLIWLTLDAAWNMVLGNVSWRNLSGPIDIAQYAGYTAQSGLVPFLAFLAIVSISLGVLNLLPIPVLDGGHVLYFAVEALKGSPLSAQAEMMGQRVGITLLLVLMCFAVYNDLMRIFG